jgi:hypothetical protein
VITRRPASSPPDFFDSCLTAISQPMATPTPNSGVTSLQTGIDDLKSEREALLKTKTFRYTAGLRSIYSRLRSRRLFS